MSPVDFTMTCLLEAIFCTFLAMFIYFFCIWPDPRVSLDGVISKTVRETIIKAIDDRLPALLEEIMTDKFEREPNLELTNAGFGWALSIALRKHWPDIDRGTAARWLWEYVGVPHGRKGYEWTYAAAQEIAAQYVSDFGEAA